MPYFVFSLFWLLHLLFIDLTFSTCALHLYQDANYLGTEWGPFGVGAVTTWDITNDAVSSAMLHADGYACTAVLYSNDYDGKGTECNGIITTLNAAAGQSVRSATTLPQNDALSCAIVTSTEPTSLSPTPSPTSNPSTASPSSFPTISPTNVPTKVPTITPTNNPSTSSPSSFPSLSPTKTSDTPTIQPTNRPTTSPTKRPTLQVDIIPMPTTTQSVSTVIANYNVNNETEYVYIARVESSDGYVIALILVGCGIVIIIGIVVFMWKLKKRAYCNEIKMMEKAATISGYVPPNHTLNMSVRFDMDGIDNIDNNQQDLEILEAIRKTTAGFDEDNVNNNENNLDIVATVNQTNGGSADEFSSNDDSQEMCNTAGETIPF